MFRPVAGLGAALALAACATVEATGPTAGAPETAPSPVEGYDWMLQVHEDGLFLGYGVAQSDDVPLVLTCEPGAGRVTLSHPAEQTRRTLTLSSGGVRLTVPVTGEPTILHDGVYLVGRAATREPALQAFRRTGWLWLHEGDDRFGLAAHPGSEAAIEQFFQACG